MRSSYPTSFVGIATWAADNNVGVKEARTRFAQYGILRAITASSTLSQSLVFKGGNALDFIWNPNRSTKDLDFSLDMSTQQSPFDPPLFQAALQKTLQDALVATGRTLGIMFGIHAIKRQPPGIDKTFVTYEINIGYALPDEEALRGRLQAGRPSSNRIPLEISTNEPICADEPIDINGTHRLRVSTIEDIAAEKLRAILQQPIRNRNRRQDLIDLAGIIGTHPGLDRTTVAEFLILKADARAVPLSRAAFHDPEIRMRMRQDYDALKETTRTRFIAFEEALEILYAFVDQLDIPQT